MLSTSANPVPLRTDRLPSDGRRSASGASTASQDTGNALSSLAESDPKYAPIRPRSQHTSQDLDMSRTATPVDSHSQAFDESGLAASLHQYNHAHGNHVDPSLGPNHASRMSFDMHDAQSRITAAHLANVPSSVTSKQRSRAHSRSTGTAPAGGAGTDAEKKERKGANNNQANEKELRELIDRNHERSLESIARDVRNAERTQKSEKAKQLFAMRWLREYCRQSQDSVPRNRVYTYYAQRCGTERVDTLNPASFGKLVRIIFPGIQTRRLGVRGESKYHYVSLTLVEDPQSQRPRSAANSLVDLERATPFENDQDVQTSSRIPTDTAAFPAPEQTFDPISPALPGSNAPSQARLFAPTGVFSAHVDNGPKMFKHSLKFSVGGPLLSQDEALELPPIQQYVPPKTDMDLANALTALYRTHCTSLVDSVRYVKEKQFVRLLGSFNGTMTVPVSRLFQQSNLAPWIKACDRVMYQQIIRFVSQLALQVIPAQVFAMLRNVSNDLVDHLQKQFGHFPDHVLHAKLETATVFCSLLSRLLRVNETAHAAANLLMNDEMRNLMWQDWVKHVRPKRVVESALSTCGHEEVYKLVTAEMRHLLAPLGPSEWFEFGTEYHNAGSEEGTNIDWLVKSDTRAESIIERWATFLQSLPARFSQASTKTLIQAIESVGNACLRDITVAQAQSFGAWWITKVWIDEMMLWMAEMGGFLSPAVEMGSPNRSDQLDSFLGVDRQDSTMNLSQDRPGSAGTRPDSAGLGIDFNALPSFTPLPNRHRHSSGPPTATFRFPSTKKQNTKTDRMTFEFHDAHDDSGIGMSLLTDDSPGVFPSVHGR